MPLFNNRAKPIRIKDDSTLTDKLVIAFAECVGTAILLFLGCMGCVTGMSGGEVPHLQVSFIFGLAVLISVQVVGHVSGSNINPVITMAAVILGHIPLISAPFYFIGQFLGAILGVGLLKVITPAVLIKASANATGACSPGFNTQISPGTAMISEFLLTLILILVCGGVWDGRNSDKHDSTAIRFGLAVAVLAMAGGPYSGANMNPARSFAPALLNGDWNNHWVWWVGPILGALVGALMYRFLLSKEKIVEAEEEGDIPLNDKQKP